MKKDNTTLLVIGCLSAALLFCKKRSASGVGRLFGGNSGYIDYSMSKRAAEARTEGRYPKTDFKRVYKMNDKTLQTLVRLGVISDKEWHHTSKYGNKTVFYSWLLDDYIQVYQDNKKQIQDWIKTHNYAAIAELFDMPYDDTDDLHIGDSIIPIYDDPYFVSGKIVDVIRDNIVVEVIKKMGNDIFTYKDRLSRTMFKYFYRVL